MMALVMLSSCGTAWIDPKLNVDPNNPSDISPRNAITAIEAAGCYTIGGDQYRYASLFSQQNLGFDRQHLGIYQYTFAEGDVSTLWQNYYSGHLVELDRVVSKSTQAGAPHVRGWARVMLAQSLGNMTDVFGDVPFSQAFQGGANFQPKYDTQEAVYNRIQSLLDSAIIDLGASVSSASPGAEDLIYGGNRPRWIRAAWSLKARYALHLSKRNRMQAATQALQFLANGMTSSADDLQLIFGATDDQSNPLYQFDQQRNDIRVHPNFIRLLNRLNDPRRPFLARTRGGDSTQLGILYASASSPVVLMSFAESKFIEAEANLILGRQTEAKAAFTAAIRGSMASVVAAASAAAIAGVTIPSSAIDTYVAQPSVVPSGDLTLERLIEQKYIALYPSSESWTDWRRTGFPALTPINGNAIPRRFPYPQTERDFNNANWAAAGGSSLRDFLFTRIWWDVQ
jgi:hypothetical protein